MDSISKDFQPTLLFLILTKMATSTAIFSITLSGPLAAMTCGWVSETRPIRWVGINC